MISTVGKVAWYTQGKPVAVTRSGVPVVTHAALKIFTFSWCISPVWIWICPGGGLFTGVQYILSKGVRHVFFRWHLTFGICLNFRRTPLATRDSLCARPDLERLDHLPRPAPQVTIGNGLRPRANQLLSLSKKVHICVVSIAILNLNLPRGGVLPDSVSFLQKSLAVFKWQRPSAYVWLSVKTSFLR